MISIIVVVVLDQG